MPSCQQKYGTTERVAGNSHEHQRKILGSGLNTTKLISRLMNYLEFHLAETARIHGVLMDIYGVGVGNHWKKVVSAKVKQQWS